MAKLCSKDFTEYVEVQAIALVSDGGGGFTEGWSNFGYIWARIQDISGGETDFADRRQTTKTIFVEAPYRSDITVLHRLVVDGLNYNIYRVDNVERKGQYMEITAETGVAN